MPQKLHLVSIFGSQFKIAVLRPRVEKSAQLSAAPLSEYAETLHELLAPPTADIEPLSFYLKKDLVTSLVQRLAPWLRRHRSAKSVPLFVPTAFGRWSEDMQFPAGPVSAGAAENLFDRIAVARDRSLFFAAHTRQAHRQQAAIVVCGRRAPPLQPAESFDNRSGPGTGASCTLAQHWMRRERLHRRAESEQSHPWPAGRERR